MLFAMHARKSKDSMIVRYFPVKCNIMPKCLRKQINMLRAKMDSLKTKKDFLFRRYIFNEMKNSARNMNKIFTEVDNSINLQVEKRT